eukprot:TRINITY_DN1068_c0_g1_i4.p1 TRINITY_DN1068_c0_g1~~TRINITY_DN1068_c0_g1_i4.p1  ORF type:complete len:167 (-),score=65.03 TRINITY_DN1068_c0_g1_i4:173-673(-)
MMLMMTAIGYLDKNDPKVIEYARVGAFSVLLACLGIQTLIRLRIKQAAESRVITVSTADEAQQAAPFSSLIAQPPTEVTDAKTKEMTVQEYDSGEISREMSRLVMSGLFTALLHFKFGFFPPLVFQPVNAFLDLIGSPLFRLHVLGTPEHHSPALKRPFKAPKSSL